MPWDSDIDVQVAEHTIHFLASYYNMTIYTCRTTHAPQGKNYMLEINPRYVDGSPEDHLNTIDARWIDMLSGVFIDITAVRPKPKHPGIMHCKDRHHYRVSGISQPEQLNNNRILTWIALRSLTCFLYATASSRIDQ